MFKKINVVLVVKNIGSEFDPLTHYKDTMYILERKY